MCAERRDSSVRRSTVHEEIQREQTHLRRNVPKVRWPSGGLPIIVVAINERQVRRVLVDYRRYYKRTRTHLSLKKDTPESRAVASPSKGRVISRPEVGGLHHRYERVAA